MFKLQSANELFYATKDSAGFDLVSQIKTEIAPGKWTKIPTGLRIVESMSKQKITIEGKECEVLPEIQIRPRSGLAAKHGITVLNSPSTIDADYRGEIMVLLINHGDEPFVIEPGDRIAQAVCALTLCITDIPVKQTERGTGGFGSSGKN